MMKMKTIINSNKEQLKGELKAQPVSEPIGYSFALSLIAHVVIWGFAVTGDYRFEVAERFTQVLKQPHLTTLDRFVQVELPTTPAPEPVAEVTPEARPEPPKIEPPKQRVKRRGRKRSRVAQVSPKPRPTAPTLEVKSQPPQDTNTVAVVSVTQPSPHVVSVTAVNRDAPAQVLQRRLSKAELRGLQRGYYSELNQMMRRERSYPRSARRRGLEGTVLVELVVDARGKLLKASVIRSSGHEVLDQAALADVRKMKRLPKPPKALKRRHVKLHIPFEYSLQS